MTTLEKINYLEKKFDAPMDIIIKTIRHCNKLNISVKNINLKPKQ
jgi:hypothetical protein